MEKKIRIFKHHKERIEARKKESESDYSLYATPSDTHAYQRGIPAWMIEDSKGDWIEQIEKDYEILRVFKRCGDIHSVKRLSDGEVFSVGDEVRHKEYLGRFSRIDKIYEDTEGLWLDHHAGAICIDCAEKTPKRTPILTSEDGVELFEGDERFWIRAINGTGRCTIHVGKVGKKANPELVYFSTRKAAEEYRLNNARMLSIVDVRKELGWQLPGLSGERKLAELIKSRL